MPWAPWAGALVVPDPLALSTAQQFEQERMLRAIDATHDITQLQGIAKQLLQAWITQRAATAWAMRQTLHRNHSATTPTPLGPPGC